MTRAARFILAALLLTPLLLIPATARATGAWLYRLPIQITNDNDSDLNGFQVRIDLDTATFDFKRAAPDLRDLRFTDESGTRYLPHWTQSIDGASATIWVRVHRVPARGQAIIYLYYGNPEAHDLSNGFRTFEFFDDFDRAGAGYFALSEPVTIAVKDQAWETQAPHTLSVIELDRDGFRYWGYYGLADCGGIGILRSNDLVAWEKMPQPLLNRDGERWPSAHFDGRVVHMVYDRDHCGTSHVVLRSSTDGLTFDNAYTVLVAQENGVRNQNPHLFWNAADGYYYLYWFRGGEEQGVWQIKARRARTPRELANPASEIILLEEPYTLAAPNMMLRDGTYYLSTEVNDNAWKTKIYAGPTPLGPFEPLPGAIVLSNNEACWFQHVFNDVLHGFYCKDTRGDGQGWVLQHRTGALTTRETQRRVDGTFWTITSGGWRIGTGGAGGTLQGDTGAVLAMNIPAGQDRLVEIDGGAADVVDGSAQLVGSDRVQYDNARMRKRARSEPRAAFGPAEVRRSPAQGWFSTGAAASASAAPEFALSGTLNVLGGFLGGIALLLAGGAVAVLTARVRRDRQA
jgi:Domain of unknown function (DUF2341)